MVLTKNVSTTHRSQCCVRRCLATLSIVEVEKVRTVYQRKNRAEQQQFLLDSALMFTPLNSSSGASSQSRSRFSSDCSLMLEGKQVCQNAFVKALGCSKERYRKVISLYCCGVTNIKRKKPVRSELTKCSEAKTWMKSYFNLVGDRMPHVQRIHLPQFLTKNDVYIRMKRELMERGIEERDIITLSTFYRFWIKDFHDVIIPQVCTSVTMSCSE